MGIFLVVAAGVVQLLALMAAAGYGVGVAAEDDDLSGFYLALGLVLASTAAGLFLAGGAMIGGE